jgi:hypothetical protein
MPKPKGFFLIHKVNYAFTGSFKQKKEWRHCLLTRRKQTLRRFQEALSNCKGAGVGADWDNLYNCIKNYLDSI